MKTTTIHRSLRNGACFAGIASIALTVGCATHPAPQELLDARDAYNQAARGPASELTPVELHEAEKALKEAHAAFDDKPKSIRTRDLAYVALRKAERAHARGQFEQAKRHRDQLASQADELRNEHARRTTQALSRTREELEERERTLAEKDQALNRERTARQRAEEEAAAAMESLRKVAEVQEEKRGLVITLSGSVLFQSGKSDLLPIAQQKLRQVSETLQEQDPSRKIVIEGHTDSRGSARLNERLSLERAESVRSYLISQGLPSDRLRAVGLGPTRPVADNKTAEGRANNRRVEIIVEKAQ